MQTDSAIARRLLPILCAGIIICYFIGSLARGKLGLVGHDSDDLMRLLQVRDFMAGQSWFDVTQYRLGLDGGTPMHWSRIPDIPLIILTGFFDLFLPYEAAEKWAFTIWPPVMVLGLIYGIWAGLKHIGGHYTQRFGLVLMAFLFINIFRFYPGAIDHHNWQIALLAIAAGFAIDPEARTRSYAISGVACALSLAIGMEVMVFIVIFCGFFTLNWLFLGSKVKAGTIGFGAAFGMTLFAVFFGTIAPSQYGDIHCDAYSAIFLVAGGLGAGGLAVLAYTLSNKSFVTRVAGLMVLGALCGLFLLLHAPQCLSNPLSDLPPIVQTLWLDEIEEAQSYWDIRGKWATEIAYMLGIQLTALAVILWRLLKGEDKRIFGLYAVLMMATIALSAYQIRFYIFGFIFAIVPLAHWIGGFYARKQTQPEKTDVTYLLALAVSIPYVWAIYVIFAPDAAPENNMPAAVACQSESVLSVMSELPAGVVLSDSNAGPHIIDRTPHRALNGNYHRNADGINTSIDMAISTPGQALELFKVHKVDYIHFCRPTQETEVIAEYAPKGLIAQLKEGRVPDYLTPIGPDLEDGAVTIYQINRN